MNSINGFSRAAFLMNPSGRNCDQLFQREMNKKISEIEKRCDHCDEAIAEQKSFQFAVKVTAVAVGVLLASVAGYQNWDAIKNFATTQWDAIKAIDVKQSVDTFCAELTENEDSQKTLGFFAKQYNSLATTMCGYLDF